jgi:hypothetical protein
MEFEEEETNIQSLECPSRYGEWEELLDHSHAGSQEH